MIWGPVVSAAFSPTKRGLNCLEHLCNLTIIPTGSYSSFPNSGNTFKVIVKITITDSIDYKGQITVSIDEGPVQYQYPTFPAETTIQRTFDFDSRDVPVGTGFFAEVRYGDDYDTGIYGENTQKGS